jgi:hypothetical protein
MLVGPKPLAIIDACNAWLNVRPKWLVCWYARVAASPAGLGQLFIKEGKESAYDGGGGGGWIESVVDKVDDSWFRLLLLLLGGLCGFFGLSSTTLLAICCSECSVADCC